MIISAQKSAANHLGPGDGISCPPRLETREFDAAVGRQVSCSACAQDIQVDMFQLNPAVFICWGKLSLIKMYYRQQPGERLTAFGGWLFLPNPWRTPPNPNLR
jgi:hypothetical protein